MSWYTPVKLDHKIKIKKFERFKFPRFNIPIDGPTYYYPPVQYIYASVWDIIWHMFPRSDPEVAACESSIHYHYVCNDEQRAFIDACKVMLSNMKIRRVLSPSFRIDQSIDYRPYDYPVTKIIEENSLKGDTDGPWNKSGCIC